MQEYYKIIQPWFWKVYNQSKHNKEQKQQKEYHLQFPSPLEDEKYTITKFQLVINKIKTSELYDCIEKRYQNIITLYMKEKDKSLKAQREELKYLYPKELLQQSIEELIEFDQNELHLEYCSFIFFRILFKSIQKNK